MDRFQDFTNGLEKDYWMRIKMKEHEIGTLKKKKRPQILSNLQKGNFFRTSYQFFKDLKSIHLFSEV